VLAIGGGMVCCFGTGLVVDRAVDAPAPRPLPQPSSLALVRAELLARYVRPIDARELAAPTISGLLRGLDDRYTVYLGPDQYRTLLDRVEATRVGVGLSLERDASRGLKVLQTFEGSPAAQAGLVDGDAILAIDGVSTRNLGVQGALAHLQVGAPGSGVVLRVRRTGSTSVSSVTLQRVRLAQHAVTARDVGTGKDRVRVIAIRTFAAGVAHQVRQLALHAPAVVLDLRGDPGGLLDEAVATASIFVPKGRIVSWDGRNVGRHVRDASGTALPPMHLAVMVDPKTASAAEIVAAAIQDHKRGWIVGQHTFGKSSLQSVEPLANGAALKLTIAGYLTPKGRDIHGKGIRPDIAASPKQTLSFALHAVRATRSSR
jgi:carboxyl-terminal processing protease